MNCTRSVGWFLAPSHHTLIELRSFKKTYGSAIFQLRWSGSFDYSLFDDESAEHEPVEWDLSESVWLLAHSFFLPSSALDGFEKLGTSTFSTWPNSSSSALSRARLPLLLLSGTETSSKLEKCKGAIGERNRGPLGLLSVSWRLSKLVTAAVDGERAEVASVVRVRSCKKGSGTVWSGEVHMGACSRSGKRACVARTSLFTEIWVTLTSCQNVHGGRPYRRLVITWSSVRWVAHSSLLYIHRCRVWKVGTHWVICLNPALRFSNVVRSNAADDLLITSSWEDSCKAGSSVGTASRSVVEFGFGTGGVGVACTHSSVSTSASRSANVRQSGQLNPGWCIWSKGRMHLKW